MFYQNMPLYLKLVNLLKAEYVIHHHLPKEYKYSLCQDIINITWELLDLFIAAQTSTTCGADKPQIVDKINYRFDSLKLRIRFLTELKLVSLGQAAMLSDSIVEIGKMIGSWRKNV